MEGLVVDLGLGGACLELGEGFEPGRELRVLLDLPSLWDPLELTAEVAGYLRYYGQTAHGMDLGFVTETIAYDVATLCELAHRRRSSAHDKLLASLLELDKEAGERRSSGGIVIPATAAMGARRLAWSTVIAAGPQARAVKVGDKVLFDPEDKAEVEVHGEVYVVMRERDVHAVAAERLEGGSTGLYL